MINACSNIFIQTAHVPICLFSPTPRSSSQLLRRAARACAPRGRAGRQLRDDDCFNDAEFDGDGCITSTTKRAFRFGRRFGDGEARARACRLWGLARWRRAAARSAATTGRAAAPNWVGMGFVVGVAAACGVAVGAAACYALFGGVGLHGGVEGDGSRVAGGSLFGDGGRYSGVAGGGAGAAVDAGCLRASACAARGGLAPGRLRTHTCLAAPHHVRSVTAGRA